MAVQLDITFNHKGDFSKVNTWLEKLLNASHRGILDKYGRMGVEALSKATPVDTGLTASSWYYEISRTSTSVSINFMNSNRNKGVPIALILQYGHGTGTGGYVQGRDYINPALQPVFEQMCDELWKEVTGVG